MPIPKVIYQTWCNKQLHPIIQNKIGYMMSLNPGYEHKLFDDNDIDQFVNENFPGEIADCYNKLNIIVAKTDFWRYLILYKNGGVYLDMDSTIQTSIDSFMNDSDDAIITAEGPDLFLQWGLIFNKGHHILKRTIELIVDNIKNNNYPNDIHKMTGPTVFTQAIRSIHEENFNENINHHELYKKTFGKEYHDHHFYEQNSNQILDITFKNNKISYRLFGRDYGGHFLFKYQESALLYYNKKHWRQEESEKRLLLT